jgi:hypothetical protein
MLDIRVSILTSLSPRPGFVRHYYNDATRRGIVTEMEEHEWLAQRFDAQRTHLRAVAYRMLGSISEADDAVQEAWLRLSRSDTSGIENLGDGSPRSSGGCAWTCCARDAQGAKGPWACTYRADREPCGWH